MFLQIVSGHLTVLVLNLKKKDPFTVGVSKYYLDHVSKVAGWLANIIDPDQTSRAALSDLGLYTLFAKVCQSQLLEFLR